MQTQPKTKQSSSLIPDCCNIGIVFRTLMFVNGGVLLGLLSRGQGWLLNAQDFIETSTLTELICLSSLICLCLLRRLVARFSLSDWTQRLLCGLVPALICYGVMWFLVSLEWFMASFPRLNISYAVGLCLLLGLSIQHYFELRAKAFSPALGEARLQALQARIRPHFLFNSLNAVLSLIRTEPKRAETALEDLADLFRVLMRDTRGMGTLQDELRFCEQYLSIEKLRLGERLQVAWNMGNLDAQDLQKIQIATLLLQPLLENAVHYGVEPSPTPAIVSIEFKRNLDKIEIRITNPYHPEGSSLVSGNQMALENIRQRLLLLYDIEAQLSTSVSNQVFEVKLHFPY